jgi:hypothetical protein
VAAENIQACLSACLSAYESFGFECESLMYYPVDSECILNTEDRLDRPDLFVDEHEDKVIYLDNNCAGCILLPLIYHKKNIYQQNLSFSPMLCSIRDPIRFCRGKTTPRRTRPHGSGHWPSGMRGALYTAYHSPVQQRRQKTRLQLQVVHVQQRHTDVHSLGRTFATAWSGQPNWRCRLLILREKVLCM